VIVRDSSVSEYISNNEKESRQRKPTKIKILIRKLVSLRSQTKYTNDH
jgi:hypothetical protein